MSVITRSRTEQHAFNERRWSEIMAASPIDHSISKIETDREGNVIMSPSAGKDHGDRQAEIVYQLKLLLPKGGVLTECGVSTQEGNKTPDISWTSIYHPQFRQPDVKVLNPAPEICVEVLSPSNSAEDIDLKRRLYFEEGAQEVWICGLEGQMKFFSRVGELNASKLCAKFPKRILTSHERLDLEQQKVAARKAGRTSQKSERSPQRGPGPEPPGPER
ncbi:MAG: Uma2 family endonuclease [Verrucomicrobia bacterium]|nr:Uma2 family endonuclease [Verrucomicrobiota bacterium]